MTSLAPITASGPSRDTPTPTGNRPLGQQDFLTLLTAQMKNQDPLNPMDNAQFMGQMAQFSTVAGIERVNDTLMGFGSVMRDMRLSAASNMLGQSVLVPGTVAQPDKDGAIRGAVEVQAPVQSMVISYSDARSGTLLHTQTLGPQAAGRAAFEWTDLPPNLAATRSPVRITIDAMQNGEQVPLDPQVYARVLSASAGTGGDDITLQVEGFGAINMLEIDAFR
ncbi:flagellar hook assembly protein FlgD [Pseudotabrizicola algicola]|uniref:Basal-body rod modification protein FlgD n=1 Tax=Pseudotabrizicola algicola TaxID=2709381 RepID=A0A6B3RGT7_9RHOB|nr:flagellar hook capping FlgD N-terminal domain-containing protein [Pseudotabrizicola algicola]NEX45247.1 flagellar biosynthesis protein FlgD [Pseudotabrizicola algicola]